MPEKITITKEQENQIIELFNNGATLQKITKTLNISKSAWMQKKMLSLGLTYRPLNSQKEEIIQLYESGKTTTELAKKYNCYISSICYLLKRNNIKMRRNEDRRIYKINKNYFKSINSHEKAAILGFFFADGYNGIPKFKINIHKKDIDYLQKISKLIQPQKANPIKFTYNGGFSHTNRQDKDIACLTLYCKEMCEDLIKLGCSPRKSLTAEFPKINKQYFNSFLLGVLDGDGTITFSPSKHDDKRKYSISIICSRPFSYVAKEIIEKEMDFHVGVGHAGKMNTIRIGGNKQVEKFLDWIYRDSPIKLNRKYKKYLNMKQYFRRYDEQKFGKKDILPLP